MTETSLLDKLLIIDHWLTDQLRTYDRAIQLARVNHDVSSPSSLEGAKLVLFERRATVRAQINGLREADVKELIAKQGIQG